MQASCQFFFAGERVRVQAGFHNGGLVGRVIGRVGRYFVVRLPGRVADHYFLGEELTRVA